MTGLADGGELVLEFRNEWAVAFLDGEPLVTTPEVSGEVDQVFSGSSRSEALDAAFRLAGERAIAAGADLATVEVVEREDLPLAYLAGDARRVRVQVVGDITPTRPTSPTVAPAG